MKGTAQIPTDPSLMTAPVHVGADARPAGRVPHLAVVRAFGVGVHPTRTGNVLPHVGAILIACLQLDFAIVAARDLGAKAAVPLACVISIRAWPFAIREKLQAAILAGIIAWWATQRAVPRRAEDGQGRRRGQAQQRDDSQQGRTCIGWFFHDRPPCRPG